jgi:methane monooxygenase component C
MEHRVCLTFEESETIDIGCRSSEDVVSAGLRQGVLLVSDCRQGTCGACRAFLAEGGYEHLLEHSPHALSDEEEEEGWVLSCRLRPQSDLVLEFDYPVDRVARLGGSRRTARVISLECCGDDLYRLVVRTIAVQAPLTWLPGQHVVIHQARSGRSYTAYPSARAETAFEVDFYLVSPQCTTSGAPPFAEGEMIRFEGPFGETDESLPAGAALARSRTEALQKQDKTVGQEV